MLAPTDRPHQLTLARLLSLALIPLFALVPLGHHPLARKETELTTVASA